MNAEWPSRGADAEDGAVARAVIEHICVYLPRLPQPAASVPAAPAPEAQRAAARNARGTVALVLAALDLLAVGIASATFIDARYSPLQRGDLFGRAAVLSVVGTTSLGWLTWRRMRQSVLGYRYWLSASAALPPRWARPRPVPLPRRRAAWQRSSRPGVTRARPAPGGPAS